MLPCDENWLYDQYLSPPWPVWACGPGESQLWLRNRKKRSETKSEENSIASASKFATLLHKLNCSSSSDLFPIAASFRPKQRPPSPASQGNKQRRCLPPRLLSSCRANLSPALPTTLLLQQDQEHIVEALTSCQVSWASEWSIHLLPAQKEKRPKGEKCFQSRERLRGSPFRRQIL